MVKTFALLLTTLFFIGITVQNSQAGCPGMDSTQEQKGMHDKPCGHMGQADKGKACGGPGHGCRQSCHSRPCCTTLLVLWAVLNVLLTILVVRDMRKTKRFNALWVPLVLVAGIPCTIIYALFRLGENTKAEETK